MARARTLKPGFFTNDVLAEIAPIGRILFQGLWCIADREGRLEDRPRKIKAEILPYDDADVDALLDELARLGFIARYQVGQARYIAVLNFGKHQTPHIKEAASVIPAPDEHGASTVQAPDKHESSPSSRAHSPSPFPHSLNPIPLPTPEITAASRHEADEPPSPPDEEVASIAEVTDERPHALVTAFCGAIGADVKRQAPKWVSSQRAVAKRLLEQGYTIDRVIACTAYRQSQTWRDDPFDLFDIEKGIGKWEANGAPARASPNGKTNGRATTIERPKTVMVNGEEVSDERRQYVEGVARELRAARAAAHGG